MGFVVINVHFVSVFEALLVPDGIKMEVAQLALGMHSFRRSEEKGLPHRSSRTAVFRLSCGSVERLAKDVLLLLVFLRLVVNAQGIEEWRMNAALMQFLSWCD